MAGVLSRLAAKSDGCAPGTYRVLHTCKPCRKICPEKRGRRWSLCLEKCPEIYHNRHRTTTTTTTTTGIYRSHDSTPTGTTKLLDTAIPVRTNRTWDTIYPKTAGSSQSAHTHTLLIVLSIFVIFVVVLVSVITFLYKTFPGVRNWVRRSLNIGNSPMVTPQDVGHKFDPGTPSTSRTATPATGSVIFTGFDTTRYCPDNQSPRPGYVSTMLQCESNQNTLTGLPTSGHLGISTRDPTPSSSYPLWANQSVSAEVHQSMGSILSSQEHSNKSRSFPVKASDTSSQEKYPYTNYGSSASNPVQPMMEPGSPQPSTGTYADDRTEGVSPFAPGHPHYQRMRKRQNSEEGG